MYFVYLSFVVVENSKNITQVRLKYPITYKRSAINIIEAHTIEIYPTGIYTIGAHVIRTHPTRAHIIGAYIMEAYRIKAHTIDNQVTSI